MRKILLLDDHFPTGESTLQPVLLWGPGGNRIDTAYITKTASEALDYIKNVQPEPGKTQMLVLALGSEEAYGPNRNGDGFPERPIPAKTKHASSDNRKWWVAPGEELTKHYQSFETNPAHAFLHHQNQDPAKASGHVKKAFWNPKMHRVELLIIVDNQKDSEWVNRVNDGDFPAVSMGCVPRGTPVLLADGRYVPIESIQMGDSVITHKGRPQRVSDTLVRPHKGTIFRVKAYGHRDPLVLTGEHPLWLAVGSDGVCRPSSKSLNKGRKQHACTPKSSKVNGGCAGCTTTPNFHFDWVETSKAQEGDYLAMPLPTFKVETTFTPDEARLLGYYLAEGYATHSNVRSDGREDRYVTLCTGIHETKTHEELYALAERFNVPITHHDVEERNGRYITLWDQRLAALCVEHCGESAKNKTLSASVLGADPDTLKLLLGAYANGDGGAYKGSLYLSTASITLSEQLRIALARCGMIASINKIHHKPSAKSVVRVDTIEYQVWVGTDTSTLLTTTRLPLATSQVANNRRFFYTHGETTYLVTKIEEIEEVPYDDDVYNFSVEVDESYVIDGLAVHNCRIKHDICSRCGNIAPTRAQYCEHVRNGMNQINPDGTKNYVHNPSPNFFDISRVFRPADRTGYTLKKVAHVYELQSSASLGEDADALANKAAAIRKLSDIEKIVRGQPVASSSTLSNGERVLIDKFREYAAPRMASMSEIPPSTFQGHPLAEALSSLASIKTPLTGPEFVRLIVSHLSGEPLPEHVVQKTAALLPTVLALFERSPALFDDVLKTGALNNAPQHVNQSLLGKLAPFAKRANLSSLLYRGLVPEGTGLRPDEAPSTDLLNYQDPRSGQTVQTTRGAATDASEAQTRAGLKKTIGGAGLLYGAYKAMGAFPSLRPLRAPAAALGAYAMMRRSPEQTFHTAEGLEVPESTEFAPQEKFSEDSLSRIVLAALTDVRATGVSTVNQALVDQLEKRGHVDTTRGVVLNLDEVAEALGNIVLA